MYDADYRASKKDFDTFVESLTERIIEKDETIPELPPKDLVRTPTTGKVDNGTIAERRCTFRRFEYTATFGSALIQHLTR